MRRIVDLSPTIYGGIEGPPMYKGVPMLEWIEPICRWDRDGFPSSRISMWLHLGTHVDTPYHVLKDGKTVEQVPLETFVGEAIVIDLTFKKPNEGITVHDLEEVAEKLNKEGLRIEPGNIVILRTDWYKKWPSPEYWEQSPFLTLEAAEWLVKKKISALGYDFFQEMKGEELKKLPESKRKLPVHNVVLRAGVCQIEYLRGLDQLRKHKVFLIAAPVKIRGAEGAPARAIAIEDY